MRSLPCVMGALLIAVGAGGKAAPPDARLREVIYDPNVVVSVPVQRGVVTLIVLDLDESIQEVASGLGADCTKADAAWCIAGQPGGRTLFVKPKSSASAPNTLAVVTNQRLHAFKLDLLTDGDTRAPLYRLQVKARPLPAPLAQASAVVSDPAADALEHPTLPPPAQLVATRLQAKPRVVNSNYTLAEGQHSADIVPSLVFDDGRFTYLRFSGNRDVPAVFHVLGDGKETLVNSRMEGDLLVADRVSRRLMLRSGSAVVGIWNESFDPEGSGADDVASVPGVTRSLRPSLPRARVSGDRP
jgi:type IV secretion system protein VirB9